MQLMRSHAEGTSLYPGVDSDVGAGPALSPYRRRPLVWQAGGRSYVNERTVSVQQTGWTFVAVARRWLPLSIRALLWWAPDDSGTAVRTPLYGGATQIPPSYGERHGPSPAGSVSYGVDADALRVSLDSAFWVFNLVAHVAYGERYETA